MVAETVAIATPLGWLKAEIDRSLGQARAALAPLRVGASAAPAALADCARPVHHIRGAMQMLGLEGAASFCNSLEQALDALGSEPARLNEISVSLLDRALFALSQFLDDIAKGEPDVPLKLFPVYRELNELFGRNEVAESELFFPDLRAVPPGARMAGTLDAAARERCVRSARSQFQRGLIGWLKDARDPDACQEMRAALDALDRIASELAAPVGFCWVAAGLLDLAASDVHAAPAFKPLLARIDRLLRELATGVSGEAPTLMREMLYRIALAAPASARVAEIKSVYALDAQLPEYCLSGTLEYDVSALAPVLDRMRARLAAMEHAWSEYAGGDVGGLARLRSETAALKTTARDLGHYRLVRLLDIVGLIASKLPREFPASNEVLALEMAAALLFMEGMLDHFTSPPPDIDQQVAVMVGWLLDALKPPGVPNLGAGAPRDDITQRQHYAEVRAQVAREILANLHGVEQTLDEIARDPSRREALLTLDAPMRQIAGALKMLGLTRANGVACACLHLMKLSATDDPALTHAALEWIADGLSCLGFYLDNLRHGETPNEDILLGFVQRLSREDAHAAGSREWVSAGDRAPATETPASAATDAVPDDSAEEAAGDDLAAASAEETEAADEDDLLPVFLAEGRALASELATLTARLRADARDAAALAEARRAFHTLKGSARIVERQDEAELAAEAERTLEHFCERGQPANEELLVLLGEAVDVLGATLAALGEGAAPDTAAYGAIRELAIALRAPAEAGAVADSTTDTSAADFDRPEDHVASEAAAAPAEPAEASLPDVSELRVEIEVPGVSELQVETQVPDALELAGDEVPAGAAVLANAEPAAPDEVVIGTVRVSSTLFAIYRRESGSLLDALREALEALHRDPDAQVWDEVARAAHTLRSTSAGLGFEAIAALATALEDALPTPGGAGPLPVDAFEAALAAFDTMLGDVSRRCLPSRDPDVEARLRTLVMNYGALEREAADASRQVDGPIAHEESPDPRLLAPFLEEADELLVRFRRELARWRRNPGAIEPARELARALHTFKGSARVAGASRLGDAAHGLESRVGMAIESGAHDDAFFDALESGIAAIAAALSALGASDLAQADPGYAPSLAATSIDAPHAPLAIGVRLDTGTADDLVAHAAEIAGVRLRIEAEMEGMRQSLHDLTDSVARLRGLLRETQLEAESQLQSRSRDTEDAERGFDPLELDRYTRLQELTRMMAESLHDVQIVHHGMLTSATETEAALALQGRVARELQHKLLRLRSLPFGALAERLQHTVRCTAAELGRDALLEIEGADIELDRSLLQRLAAPLEHMLRNALAHGIETPPERAALGKPAVGRIALRLERPGLEVVLTLSDDGSGLDLARIRRAAIALGLIAPSDTRPDAAFADLIFAPGLSTATQLSASSGRGIGLDVASTEIASLGGSIEVASTPGAGTSFRIRLPLSAAAARVLLVRSGDERYAIPCALVDGVEDPSGSGSAESGDGRAAAASRYPLHRLGQLLGKPEQPSELERGQRLLLLRSGEQRMALQVDAILREQEVILKPLGPQLARVPGLAGATVLGNEEVVLVIDPLVWRERALAGSPADAPAAPRSLPEREPAHILVADDSLTVRRLTGRLLLRAGYRVSTAKDGLDALEQIRRSAPSLIVLDLEMPRMDGFELIRQLRGEARTVAIPIVIVSSRLAEKHRRRALELGADAFFGKPYPEEELLACVASLLGVQASIRAA